MKALTAILGVLVIGCVATNVMLFQRVRELERKAPLKTGTVAAGSKSSDAPVPADRMEPASGDPVVPAQGTAAPAPVVSGAARSGAESKPEITPAMKAALAAEVERHMKEKYGDLPHIAFHTMDDPITVMEKELTLTPNQKMAIGDLWKKREQELMKAFEEHKMSELGEKAKEIEERYDAAIKQQLDITQQGKYDQLKKDGKLNGGGVVFQMDVKSTEKDK